MANFKRGDLIKAAAAVRVRGSAAVDQYWRAYRDKSIGLVVKADADHIWVRWFGSRSDQNTHKYYNKTKYFKLVSRNDQF